ncbi:Cell division control protein 6-like protein [Thalictrum thalictroides]|uniref:Cell division control protein n=1 Tax=Thalictrum thalictroides TaxID=46969 RepID=A0A7J6X1G1_THATH|nr:Cell division control protein 6-like protein [Thalictrum thalictroides]
MPSLIRNGEVAETEKRSVEIQSSPLKRRLRSHSTTLQETTTSISTPLILISPEKRKSPRKSINCSPNGKVNGVCNGSEIRLVKSPRKRISFPEKPKWNPKDSAQMSIVKEALHVSSAPLAIVCREDEQKRVFEFCRTSIQEERGGSLYVCGCPGTGKTLSMEKVKQNLLDWVKEGGFHEPNILAVNCTSLGNTNEIFNKMLEVYQPLKKVNRASSALQHLQKLFSQKKQSSSEKMMLIVADELDYLITKDRSVLHDLFMLTNFPFSRCILIGIANALDLADRFLPKLQALNCKPVVVTFRAYSKDQILRILRQRLAALSFDVFNPQALELCARKVAAASGDMRKALCVCRSAIEMLEEEFRDTSSTMNLLQQENTSFAQPNSSAAECFVKQETNIVRVDHMALALSRIFKSTIVDIIQSLPQHQQILLCSMVKLFRGSKKDTTVGELNQFYIELCKSSHIPPAGFLETSNMCRVLSDQGILKIGQSKDDRSKRVTLKVDEVDVTFALQGIRFFRNCLQ